MGEARKRIPLEQRDFMVKLARARKHLHDIEDLVEEYRASTRIEVRRATYRKKFSWELHIALPPSDLPLILGDFLYNVRSALDYLMVSLLPNKYRSSGFYPILGERIWEIPASDDESDHLKDMRRRWALIEDNVAAEVVEIIKSMHPPGGRPSKTEPMHDLVILNGLSNRDRHRNLNVVAAGVDAPGSRFEVEFEDGHVEISEGESAPPPYRRALATGARIEMPPSVAHVNVTGRIIVVVEVSREWSNVEVPGDMQTMWETACALAGHLEPYCR